MADQASGDKTEKPSAQKLKKAREQGQAPRIFAATSRHGVPWVTVLTMAGALLGGVVLNYLIPENVFLIIASIATFATVWVWLMILLSQVAMRRRLSA